MTKSAFRLLALLSFTLCPLLASAAIVDRNIAIVNNETITASEVHEAGQPFFQQVLQKTPPEQQRDALVQARMLVIQKLIERKLLLQEAKKYKIEVSESEIDGGLQRILAKNNATIDQFRKELVTMNMTEAQYREGLREQLLSAKLINAAVRSRVVIPEDTIRAYYDKHYAKGLTAEGSYHLLQIGCVWDVPDRTGTVLSRSAAKVKAEKLHQMAMSGKNFTELARLHSDLPSADDSGDLGNFTKDEMAPYMQEAVLGLQPGEISEVVEVEGNFQFFKLLSSREEGAAEPQASYEAAREQIHEQLYQKEMEKRFETWIKEIRDKAYIKIF